MKVKVITVNKVHLNRENTVLLINRVFFLYVKHFVTILMFFFQLCAMVLFTSATRTTTLKITYSVKTPLLA